MQESARSDFESPALLRLRLEELSSIRSYILGAVATLLAVGLVLVYSASAIRSADRGWELEFAGNQARWLLVGFGGMLLASLLDLRWVYRLWPAILCVCLGLLVLVRLPGVGTCTRGAYRWFRFAGLSVQPSEIAKPGLVLVLACLLARRRGRAFSMLRDLLPAAAVIGAAAGLVALEPDLGTAALIAAVLGCMLVAAGARWWQISLLVAASLPVTAYYALTHFEHVSRRVRAWSTGATGGAGWQPFMSKLALGTGGTTGVGLGQGHAKLYYLPDAHTDFILAIAGQELGLLGTLFILVMFCLFIISGMRLTGCARDRRDTLVAFGITMLIGLQGAFNVAVVTGAVPPKGISLPFVSFGGSGLCMSLFGVGLLLNIVRRARADAQRLASPPLEVKTVPLTWRERVRRGQVPGLEPGADSGREAA